MSHRTPQEWREILADIRHPEEVRKAGSRRARRRAKAVHHQQMRRRSHEWVREQRRRDPIRPTGAAIIVVVVLALGVGTRWVWPGLLGEKQPAATVGEAPAAPEHEDSEVEVPATSASPGTPSETPAALPSPAGLDNPDRVAERFARDYLTRNPPQDQTHKAVVERVRPLLAPALTANLSEHTDPAWDKLVSQGGISTVRSVAVTPSGKDLPGDSPLRVWRRATTVVDVDGYTDYSETTVLQLELMTSGGQWHITRILGV
ncbi:hypothetical protein ADK90_34795 [Streptomyces sp. XY413]|uniref:hypothetical protein n=1 Tax=unclassified Streptomyces TaxID=2593676 RepID=UPI0006AED22C|nr:MULTISPECIES: hypothetical protein [unclassified Streptomyces]KOU89136.1 hypothetical protein ADK61_01900 [Streptomyces sp. XY66]KOV14212.1 hypothetical protein ADK90_34795 [Streptomyces sp. XY413]